MVELVLNEEHTARALGDALLACRHRLFIATADVKDIHLPGGGDAGAKRRTSRRGRDSQSIIDVLGALAQSGVEVRLLHGAVPSGPFLGHLKEQGLPLGVTMKRCPRVHVKTVIVDGKWMYLGSANLTGAGLGAKSAKRRNFEAGVCTDELRLIDPVVEMLHEIWEGVHCHSCGRSDYCPVPLEQPDL